MTFNTALYRSLMCGAASIGVLGLGSLSFAQNPSQPAGPGMGGVRPDQNSDRPGREGMNNKWDKSDKSHGMHDMKAAHDKMLDSSLGFSVRPLAREQASTYSDLRAGVGLVVDNVSADSKAAKAGLKNGDVIFKLDDQWVINTPQLCTLFAIQEANDDFELKVYRGTERVDLDFEFDQAALDDMNRMHDQAMGSIDSSVNRSMTRTDSTPGDMDRDNRDDLAGVPAGQAGLIIPENFDYEDDQHSFDLRTDDGSKKLTVKDQDGNVLFEGPYNTQAERDAVPADIKAKFERALREKVK